MNPSLRIPFCVSVRSASQSDIENLLDCLEHDLGGRFFRTRELFLEVLHDRGTDASKPLSFLPGPFLRVTSMSNETLRITSVDHVPAGDSVYAPDQVFDAFSVLGDESYGQSRPRG